MLSVLRSSNRSTDLPSQHKPNKSFQNPANYSVVPRDVCFKINELDCMHQMSVRMPADQEETAQRRSVPPILITFTLFREKDNIKNLEKSTKFPFCTNSDFLINVSLKEFSVATIVGFKSVKHKFIFRLLDLAAGDKRFHQRFSASLHLITLILSGRILRNEN